MAQNAPPSQDVQDIQFKLHDRFKIFGDGKDVKSLVSLLAVSSAKGLLFAGNQNNKELKVFKLRDIVDSKTTGQDIKVRVIKLPGEPKILACSCDGSMLAVNYVLNNTGFLQIYQVDSFLAPTLNTLYNLPVSPESNVFALQLLWNPVISNSIALVLTDGSVAMFTLNNGGQYDKVTLGKDHQVKSGCWSPKGKQIVFGFPEGRLQQFKPNLQPARVIQCPPGIHPGPFDCIAVHWLSTFQFAAIFLQNGQDMCPSLFIINAPKAGQPVYTNYYDICYSAPGPRIHQLSFNHIAQWNILLVTSANGVEVGVLGTKDSGETPHWVQYTLLDEARIEMPLTESKDETYPLGFAFDIASAHQVIIGEKKIPVMPMIHLLSTHGHLVSYNFLNLSPNAVDLCSPPPPLNDTSGQFVSLRENLVDGPPDAALSVHAKPDGINKQNPAQGFGDMTFTLGTNNATSTPTLKDKSAPLFGAQTAPMFGSKEEETRSASSFGAPTATGASTVPIGTKPTTGFGFGAVTPAPTNVAPFSQPPSAFGGFSGSGFMAKTNEAGNLPPPQQNSNMLNKNTDANKPLYTVPPTFTPPNISQQQQAGKIEVKPMKPVASSNKLNLDTGEIGEVVKQMIVIQIEAFDTELRQIRQQSKQLMENIGYPNDIKAYTKHLNDLHEIVEQANDHEFEQDVQSLRHSMNESYAMLAECRTKLDLYHNPTLGRLSTVSCTDPTSRRQLAKLQAYAALNQNQLSQLNQLIDAQWSQYQDVVRRNSKNQMHIPCLDGIYQRMSKLKDLLSKQRTKMNYIKTKLKQKGLNYKPAAGNDVTAAAVGALTKNQSTMESLADSILSMSLSQVVAQTHAKLSEEKLNAIRDFTKRQQQIAIIKPKRPDRVGLKSEVILETKLETERKQKEIAKKHLQQQQQLQQQLQQQVYQQQYQKQQQQLPTYKTPINYQQQQQNYQTQLPQQLLKPQVGLSIAQQQQQQPILAKPTASKPAMVSSQPPAFITPTSSAAATLSFGGNSSFVKTSLSASKSEETTKSLASNTPFSAFSTTMFQEGHAKPTQSNEMKENKPTSAPISFSAKVIGGNDAKPFANLSNKTTTQSNTMSPQTQGFSVPASTGFSAFATTKPTTQSSSQDRKLEEAPKQFSFAAAPTSMTSTTSIPPAFSGFSGSTKPTTTAMPHSTTAFASNTSTATPFAALSTSSSFSFNAPATTASTVVSTAAANNSSKSAAASSSPSQGAADVTAKPTAAKTSISVPIAPSAGTTSSSAASNTAVSGTKSSAATNVTTTSSGLSEPKPAAPAPVVSSATTLKDEPADTLLGSLNICKPTAKQAGDSKGNIFSGFTAATPSAAAVPFSFAAVSAADDGTKPFLGLNSAGSTGTTSSSGFSFVSAASSTPAAANVFEKPTSKATSTTESTTTSVSMSTAATTTVVPSANTAAPVTSPFSFKESVAATASTASSLFGSLSVSSSTAVSTAVPTVTTTSVAPSGNIFGGGSSLFGQTTTAASTSTTTSIFGGGAAVASPASSLFGNATPAAAPAASPGSGSIFANSTATASQAGSIFGGIPKPEQSIFSASNTATQPNTGLFATAAANSKLPAATAGSIFGGGSSTGFSGSSGASIFGAASSSPFSSTATANTGGSMFAAAAGVNKPAEGGSIFGSPTQQSATSGGSIFSKPTFGATAAPQSAGSIFGGGNAQSPTSGGFGASGGSIFGGSTSANPSVSGGSLFGTGAATSPGFGAPSTSPGFGAFSQPSTAPAFGSPTAGGFGAPASSGFASPPQQQSTFAAPAFGGPATFGSPQPTFGAQTTFGGAPTFGSPKGFGSFAATSPTAAGFGAPNQTAAAPKGNIFETLGSQDSGLSFGNLAHNTQAPQQKPTFGGSSFMNYRS